MKTVIIVIVALAVIGGGIFALTRGNKNSSGDTSQAQTTAQTTPSPNTQPATNDQSAAGTITYTNAGFSPATLTIKAGSNLTVVNNSDRDLQFSSDPHPQHTDDPELNMDVIGPGQSQTITVTQKGNFGYHNHIFPGDTGRIIVE